MRGLLGVGRSHREPPVTLRSITAVPCTCRQCGWNGLTGECEADDEGTPICPICPPEQVPVEIHYSEHERNPTGASL